MIESTKARKKKQIALQLLECFAHCRSFTLEQDHASIHDSNYTQKWCQEHVPNFLSKSETPAKMDDIWCIERLWGVMTKKVYEYPAPKTMEELKERIVNCWNDISSKTLRKMVHQMPLRIKEVLRIKGNKLINFKQSCQCSFCQNNS